MHVPVWYAQVEESVRSGRVRWVGIVEEQHPERAALFAQWKQLGGSLLVDRQDRLQVLYVPILLGLDARGVVRFIGPAGLRPEAWERFLAADVGEAPGTVPAARVVDPPAPLEALVRRVHAAPEDGWAHFRLGVAYRQRWDSAARQPGDFARAAAHWSRALDIDPNNYIWRRRLQQYGPRLAKPYPFYDWVPQARREITARGENPVELPVEPGGSEYARPGADPGAASVEIPTLPRDPEGRIHRDTGALIEIETLAVPPRANPGEAVRAYVVLRPRTRTCHWNNETEPLAVHLELPAGWEAHPAAGTVAAPRESLSRETRRVEFEIRIPEVTPAGTIRIPAYALYAVCEDAQGACLWRRQDAEIVLEVAPTAVLGGR